MGSFDPIYFLEPLVFIYEFRYCFGPFEGDYVFHLKGVSPYIDDTRSGAINYCRKLIKKDIDENVTLMNKFKEKYPEEDNEASFKFTLDDLQSKLDDLNKYAEVFIFSGHVHIDQFRSIGMKQLEVLTL